MKLNEIASGKIWLLLSDEVDKDTIVHGIYTSKALAEKDRSKIETDYWRESRILELPLNKYRDVEGNWLDTK